MDENLADPRVISLQDFVADFGDDLMASLEASNPPVYTGEACPRRDAVFETLKRKPFDAQRHAVQACARLLLDRDEQAAVLNAEMGTGKTMMAICLAALMYAEGYGRTLIISPPHLVYKWRREILETLPAARVWVFNGPDTLMKLLKLRALLREQGRALPDVPEFFILGRVRMRMGFHWRPACWGRQNGHLAVCPSCGAPILDEADHSMSVARFVQSAQDRRVFCRTCNGPLWTLMRPERAAGTDRQRLLVKSMCQIPTIGPATAERLLGMFGGEFLAGMLADNVHEVRPEVA